MTMTEAERIMKINSHIQKENELLKARCEAAESNMKLLANNMDGGFDTLPCILCAKNNENCDVSDTCFEWRGPGKEEAE